MKKANRTKNIIVAGTLTGLALAVTLAFGGQDLLGTKNIPLENAAVISVTESITDQTLTVPQLLPEQRDSLQAQNEQLARALLIMQEREGQYQVLIESANQTIQQLQNEGASPAYQGEYDEEEEEDHGEYIEGDETSEDHEHGHEAYEREDEDDD